MAKCWELRGCDDEMMADCPHFLPGERCPAKCAFAQCDRPSHRVTGDPALVFDPTADRAAAIKETCLYCAFFLEHGPRVVHG